MNLLGRRQPEVYGRVTFEDHLTHLRKKFNQIQIDYFQSNHEGALIDKLQEIGFSSDGIVLNPAAYTHTSIAIADTIQAIPAPVIEVHISNIYEREEFRHHSFVSDHVLKSIVGKGLDGYDEAVKLLMANSSKN